MGLHKWFRQNFLLADIAFAKHNFEYLEEIFVVLVHCDIARMEDHIFEVQAAPESLWTPYLQHRFKAL